MKTFKIEFADNASRSCTAQPHHQAGKWHRFCLGDIVICKRYTRTARVRVGTPPLESVAVGIGATVIQRKRRFRAVGSRFLHTKASGNAS
jgi:hypothetical protein